MNRIPNMYFADNPEDRLYPALFQCFALISCGYIAGRLNVVTSTESKGIATFVGTFALPSLIFLSLAQLDFSIVNWTFLLAVLLAKGIVFFGVIIVTVLISKPVNLGKAGIYAIFSTQSNDFALGYPIIDALFRDTNPEYSMYLYLMAPISLAILNPIAFVLMEINKQKEQSQLLTTESGEVGSRRGLCNSRLLIQTIKGIAFNPVLVMTVLGIIGNIVFKHHIPVYLQVLLEVFGQAFSASALFLLGLRMVGQVYRLTDATVFLPFLLIAAKLLILPLVLWESVVVLKAGVNESDTSSLSMFAFLYGTIPTAPAVFVFSNLYQLEIDMMASSMVLCTFLSMGLMFISAAMITIKDDYLNQLRKFGFGLSIMSLLLSVWLLIVFTVTKKYKRMPHKLTLCLLVTQMLVAISVIWDGPIDSFVPSWLATVKQAICAFSTFSCILWTAMLTIGMFMLQTRGPCFVVTLWPVLGFVAWGAPAVIVMVLALTQTTEGGLNDSYVEAIRFGLHVFCLCVTTTCLIIYMRSVIRSERFASLSAAIATTSSGQDEGASLIDNVEPISNSHSTYNNGCYRTITATPSPNRHANGCCSDDPNCEHGLVNSQDIEDIGDNVRDCVCPSSQHHHCNDPGACQYLNELERAASQLGLLPPEHINGRGGEMPKHTILIIVYILTMFTGIAYTTLEMLSGHESGSFMELQFLNIAGKYGQPLVMFVLFGLDPQEVIMPAIRFLKKKWYGADTVILPNIEDLSFETKHVCDQFIKHHLERCKQSIAKDTRWRMRTYKNVFRGSCLVRWLISCGLAKDDKEAVTYGRHLLEGRLIEHLINAHHFSNSPLLYTFK